MSNACLLANNERVGARVDSAPAGDAHEIAGAAGEAPSAGQLDGPGWCDDASSDRAGCPALGRSVTSAATRPAGVPIGLSMVFSFGWSDGTRSRSAPGRRRGSSLVRRCRLVARVERTAIARRSQAFHRLNAGSTASLAAPAPSSLAALCQDTCAETGRAAAIPG